jgi:hypothetical protein
MHSIYTTDQHSMCWEAYRHRLLLAHKHHRSVCPVVWIYFFNTKNVAGTYSLEHKGESGLFSQLFALLQLDIQNDDGLRRELASCTGAIQTCITQHMSKEEEQVRSGTIYPF